MSRWRWSDRTSSRSTPASRSWSIATKPCCALIVAMTWFRRSGFTLTLGVATRRKRKRKSPWSANRPDGDHFADQSEGRRPSYDDSMPSQPWWRTAAIYQVYVRSFSDSDGDGLGDLPGVTARIPYIADLGVDAIWLNPVYPSPQSD